MSGFGVSERTPKNLVDKARRENEVKALYTGDHVWKGLCVNPNTEGLSVSRELSNSCQIYMSRA